MFNRKFLIIIAALFVLLFAISTVSAEKVQVTPSDTFMYYSEDTPASQSGYSYAIVIDGVPYYISSSVEDKICDLSDSFKSFYEQETMLNYGHKEPSSEGIIRGYHFKIYEGGRFSSNDLLEDTEFENDASFEINWETGKVGYNSNAHIVKNAS